MKKCFVIFFVLTALTGFLLPEETDGLLKITVRAAVPPGLDKNFEKKDFKLFINGEPREILEFFPKSKAIVRLKPDRTFVLVFDITGYNTKIAEAVSYFSEHIFIDSDRLLLVSPLKQIHAGDVTGSRQQVASKIAGILKNDSAANKKELQTVRDNLEGLAGMVSDNSTTIKYFLNTYPRLFDNFKTRFVLPDINNLNSLALNLMSGTDEIWWIHFQDREVLRGFSNFFAARRRIQEYITGLIKSRPEEAASLGSALQAVDRAVSISSRYPAETVLDFMQGLNINYNVIIFGGPGDTADSDRVSIEYENILKDITQKTGGLFIDSADPPGALQTIKENTDYYYDLVFEFNGKSEDKHINLEIGQPGIRLFYKDNFPEDVIKSLAEKIKETKLEITGYALQGHNLKFKISGIRIEREKNAVKPDSGILKIDIRLINDKNEAIYSTGRTLKPERETVDISLFLPAEHSGYFKLNITAADMLSGRKAESNKYIKLK